MSTPRAVSRNLKRTAGRIARIRSDGVAEAAAAAVERAAEVGGTFRFGSSRPYRMYGSVTKISNRGDTSTAIVHGVPTGAWSIKSNGRRGGYDVRARDGGPLDLRGVQDPSGPRSVHIAASVRGDGRWSRVVGDTADGFGDLMELLVEEAIDDG